MRNLYLKKDGFFVPKVPAQIQIKALIKAPLISGILPDISGADLTVFKF